MYRSVTVMLFCVNVPVLSVQMQVALPITSQEARVFTKLLSSFILFTLYARAIVTANGRPSGTATTIIVTAIKKAFIISYSDYMHIKQWFPKIIWIIKWTMRAPIVKAATIVPITPISSAIDSSFYYKGVAGLSSSKLAFNLPSWVFMPTAQTTIFPVPSIIFVPEITKQLSFEFN